MMITIMIRIVITILKLQNYQRYLQYLLLQLNHEISNDKEKIKISVKIFQIWQ